MKNYLGRSIVALALGCSATFVLGHANVKPILTLEKYNGNAYPEGQTIYFDVNLFHGCHDSEAGISYATTDVSVMFPNANDLEGIAHVVDFAGQERSANAIMRIKPKVNSNWGKVKPKKGDVPEYWSRSGMQSVDTRAVKWKRGYVSDDHYDNLEIQANLPILSGCTSTLVVYLPTVQYCKNGDYAAWIKEPTAMFTAAKDYVPAINVIRDLETNPLPSSCEVGETVEVYPTADDIDKFLPIKRKHTVEDK